MVCLNICRLITELDQSFEFLKNKLIENKNEFALTCGF